MRHVVGAIAILASLVVALMIYEFAYEAWASRDFVGPTRLIEGDRVLGPEPLVLVPREPLVAKEGMESQLCIGMRKQPKLATTMATGVVVIPDLRVVLVDESGMQDSLAATDQRSPAFGSRDRDLYYWCTEPLEEHAARFARVEISSEARVTASDVRWFSGHRLYFP